jgi:hypothetical protein
VNRLARIVALSLGLALASSSVPALAREIREVVEDLAKGEDFRLRVSAALALGKSGDPSVRGPLEKALSEDSHPAVRTAAAAALGALGDADAIPALKRATQNDSSASVRSAATSSLAKLGSSDGGSAKPSKARVLVKLGKMTNRSNVRGTELATVLQGAAREHAGRLAGVEVLPEDKDAKTASAERKLPVFTLDGTIAKVERSSSGSSTVISARVEFVIKKDSSLKGSVSGAAQGQETADADSRRLASLQEAVVSRAVESALRGAPEALAMASK